MDKELFNFYKNALVDGLCDEYKSLWQAANNDKFKLVNLAMCQQSIPFVATYCHQGNGLSKEYIKREFHDYINGRGVLRDCDGINGYTYGLYVDHTSDLSVSDDVLSFMWCNISSIEIKPSKCPILYFSNNSKCGIVSGGYNTIRVYLFDESEVTLSDIDENSEIVIYRYSDNCKVILGKYCMGKIKEHDKKLRLL